VYEISIAEGTWLRRTADQHDVLERGTGLELIT
jgi:hypothetical protein